MKLYATITSERASKGQGGNLFVSGTFTIDEKEVLNVQLDSHNFIYIRDGKGKEIACLMLTPQGNIEDITEMNETKGKRQKGECPKCNSSNCEIRDDASFHCLDCDFTED